MKSLSDRSITNNLDDRWGVYIRLLGPRPRKGQPFNLVKLIKTGLPLSAGARRVEDSLSFLSTACSVGEGLQNLQEGTRHNRRPGDVLINPRHPDFDRVTFSDPIPFPSAPHKAIDPEFRASLRCKVLVRKKADAA